jgi:hypothetical protein
VPLPPQGKKSLDRHGVMVYSNQRAPNRVSASILAVVRILEIFFGIFLTVRIFLLSIEGGVIDS